MENLKVCRSCLLGIESREGHQITLKHQIEEDDTTAMCDWCEQTADEGGFDVIYELL